MAQQSLTPESLDLGDTARRTSIRIRWVLVALLVIGGVVNYLDRATLSVANTTAAGEFGLNATEMGLLLAAFSWPYAIANSPPATSSTASAPSGCTPGPPDSGPW
jgi:sugar phosphate permease